MNPTQPSTVYREEKKMPLERIFKDAINSKSKIKLVFDSKEDGTYLTRECAPMDFGPSRRAKNKDDRFHFWDYESDVAKHVLSLLPHQVINITILEEKFEPAEFISWDITTSPWFYKRDWGQYS